MTRKELYNHFLLLDSLRKAQELQSHLKKKAEKEKDNARLFPILQDSLTDTEKEIAKQEKLIAESSPSVVAFIDSVDVLQVKQLLKFRYCHGLTWCEVSIHAGKSENACREICSRYLRKHGIM